MADGEDIRRERDDTLTVRELLTAWHLEKGRNTRTADELRDKVLHYLGKLAVRRHEKLTPGGQFWMSLDTGRPAGARDRARGRGPYLVE